MSSQPERIPERGERSAASRLLAEAMQDDAVARSRLAAHDERIQRARQQNADVMDYTWETDDAREAGMAVYYSKAGGETEIHAAELVTLDDRAPTRHERLRYEQQFEDELYAAGDRWLDVFSHIWDRGPS